jgi:hypothetical protein
MKYLLFLIYLTATLNLHAQKKQNIYYLNQQNVEVLNPDSSYYSRIIQEPDTGSTFCNLIEIYKNGKVKTEGDGVARPHVPMIKSNDLDGSVAYRFDIDRFGNIGDFKLIKSLSTYSDKKALEFIQKKKWHPASNRGITQDTFGFLLIIGYRLD